MKISRKQ